MSFTCKVEGCRYKNEHLTERHCCGKCTLNGHGQIECGNDQLIQDLKALTIGLNVLKIEYPCNLKDCIDPHSHTTKGHSCLYCDKRENMHLRYCPLNINTTEDNSICDDITKFDKSIVENITEINLKYREYTKVYGGMGCIWFVRSKNGNNEYNEYLFMHSDSWGQYGKETSHLPRYKAFIYGYTLV
jgi:hypothetical protein